LRKVLGLAFGLLVLPALAAAQEPDPAAELAAAQALNAELMEALGTLAAKLDQAETPLAAQRQELAQARYQHAIDLLAHRTAVFRWQLVSSYVVLGIVALVTLAGLVFSAAQLFNALRLSQPQDNIDLEISASKVRITSSVVGVVVLTLSIVFLFLFLDRIYEIREIGAPPAQETAAG
jgi:hypothetical protein